MYMTSFMGMLSDVSYVCNVSGNFLKVFKISFAGMKFVELCAGRKVAILSIFL